ncbi:hypothetical protein UN63_01275 [Oceanisphaera arctica]|uniref:Uncharacterized protein n=1 Tax=Oceanisphaera arctica TaxID=641510 RepID=A0A2P5TRA8_9GAMM|nr:hypothetical protein UN63_01275 [Oceanisphaera arctica]
MSIFTIGFLVFIFGGILFLIESFKVSITWGVACFLIAPVILVFTVIYWDVAKKPFLIQLAGFCIMFFAVS